MIHHKESAREIAARIRLGRKPSNPMVYRESIDGRLPVGHRATEATPRAEFHRLGHSVGIAIAGRD
jgi:hypothetical protein